MWPSLPSRQFRRSRSVRRRLATRSVRRRGIVGATDRRFVSKVTDNPRTQVGFSLFEAFGRIWLLAGGIVVAGVAGQRADGLTAALVIFGAYSIAFIVRLVSGPPPPKMSP